MLVEAQRLIQEGRLDQARDTCQALLVRDPNDFDAVSLLGLLAARSGEIHSMIVWCERAQRLRPDLVDVHLNLAFAQLQAGQPRQAISAFAHAVALDPQNPFAHFGLGNARSGTGELDEAIESYRQAIRIQPLFTDALFNLANVLHKLGRLEDAIISYQRMIALQPQDSRPYVNLGAAQRQSGMTAAAVETLRTGLKLDPDNPLMHMNLGNAFRDLGQLQQALASLDQALALMPNSAEVFNNRGLVLQDLHQEADALESFGKALMINPNFPAAMSNLANQLSDLDRHVEAMGYFEQLLRIAPESDYALGGLFHSRLHCCDWTDHARLSKELLEAVLPDRRDGPFSLRTALPGQFLPVSDSAAAQLNAARLFSKHKFPPAPVQRITAYQHERVRLAYVSGDFRDHAVAFLLAGVFEQHDRARFESFAISLRPEQDSPMGQRLKSAFDHSIDVSAKSDMEVTRLMCELEIDIAVDLVGYTSDMRPNIFARRAAPIQVNYLGFPGTLGAPYFDYIIADQFVIPEHDRCHYAEQVVYMPDCFQANDEQRRIGVTPTRAQAGLPESGFVFCCFNNTYKLNPCFFDIWLRLLQAVPGSVLWLVAPQANARANLEREAAARSVDPKRLIYANQLPYAEHLARIRLADLFLDTLPFNAGTTASDALWAGLPVLTCAGEAFAARMAGSLLTAIGLPELITYSCQDYEALALALATDPQRLHTIRAQLALNRSSYPLFDTTRFTRHLESAFLQMTGRAVHSPMDNVWKR
jgi:protein O-GlcNAc transferase